MIGDWRILHPWFLVLLPLPLAWLLWHQLRGARRTPSFIFSDVSAYAKAGVTMKTRALRLLPAVRALALMLGIVALARPQYGEVERRSAALGVDIALSIDVSESMRYQDFHPNRLEVAKDVVREFVEGRESDRISLVVFGETAAVLAPATLDRNAIKMFIESIKLGIIPGRATAIGMGLAMAVDKLKDSEAKSKVVILLTDGENNSGTINPEQAAEMAKALGVRVYAIGVGSNKPTMVGDAFFGQSIPPVDESTLRHIAVTTGGKYYLAQSEDALRQVYEEIDQLERTEIEVNEFENFDERFMLFWTPALLLLVIEFLAHGFWLVRVP